MKLFDIFKPAPTKISKDESSEGEIHLRKSLNRVSSVLDDLDAILKPEAHDQRSGLSTRK